MSNKIKNLIPDSDIYEFELFLEHFIAIDNLESLEKAILLVIISETNSEELEKFLNISCERLKSSIPIDDLKIMVNCLLSLRTNFDKLKKSQKIDLLKDILRRVPNLDPNNNSIVHLLANIDKKNNKPVR